MRTATTHKADKFTLPENLRIFKGDLWNGSEVIRERYCWHYNRMKSLKHVKATLRAGGFTWPGFYPLYLITDDGGGLCFTCALKEWRQIVWDWQNKASTGWRVVACDVNYESDDLYCDHCSQRIESAYGEGKPA